MKHIINNEELFQELRERSIRNLFHANSVETSLSFFRVASLLSRHECQKQGLPQSKQWSDTSDQTHAIFDDVFLNFSDLHRNFKCSNAYGPILFCISVDKLEKFLISHNNIKIHITKLHPHKWKNSMTDDDKWRSELMGTFLNPIGTINQSYVDKWTDLVMSGVGGSGIPLNICEKVIIDEHPNNDDFFSQVSSAFNNCMAAQSLSFPIIKRDCSILNCKCKKWEFVQKKGNEYKYSSGAWESKFGKIA